MATQVSVSSERLKYYHINTFETQNYSSMLMDSTSLITTKTVRLKGKIMAPPSKSHTEVVISCFPAIATRTPIIARLFSKYGG